MSLRLLAHNIVVQFRYTMVLLLTMVQYGSPYTPVIDTMEGGAQQRQSYTFNYTYTVSDGGGYYGDVEFRRGITTDGTLGGASIELGITPPINGKFSFTGDDTGLSFHLKNDVTLGRVSFEPPTIPSTFGYYLFIWGTDGDTNPYTVSLTQDLVLADYASVWLISETLTGTGYFDGGGHKMTLTDFSLFEPGIGNGTVVIRNITIEGAGRIVAEGPGNKINFENVTLYAGANDVRTAMLDVSFRGLNNIVGGGTIDFGKTDYGLYTRILTHSQLRVEPQTRFILAGGQLNAANFIFDDPTAVLFLDNCSLEIGSIYVGDNDKMVFLKGTVYVNGNVTLKAGTPGSYLEIGDGVDSANNCNIIILPGSSLTIDAGAKLVNKNV